MNPVEVVRTAQLVVVLLSIGTLAAAAGFTLYRLSKGPTSLDRIIASDLIVGIAVGAFALHVVVSNQTTTLPIMLAISLVGFIGAVSMARFVHDRPETSRRDIRRTRRHGDARGPVVRGERPGSTSAPRTPSAGHRHRRDDASVGGSE